MKASCIFIILFFTIKLSFAQKYYTIGNAYEFQEDWYVLTEDEKKQAGAIWYLQEINLKKNFDVFFQLNFGHKGDTSGADGIAIILQKQGPNSLNGGGGIGYVGIRPSIICEFDTFTNKEAPIYDKANLCDHMSIQKNGYNYHSTTGELAPAKCLPEITDNLFHKVILQWRYLSPSNQQFKIIFDQNDTIEYIGDIINNQFYGDTMTYIGFTSATGDKSNKHQVILDYVSIYEELKDTTTYCTNDPIQLNYPIPGTNYQWTPITNNVQASDLSTTNIPNPLFTPSGFGIHGFKIAFDHEYFNSKTTDTVYIKVLPPINITVNNDSVCYGQETTLTAIGEDLAEFKWGNNPINTSATYTFKPTKSQDITIIGYDKNGCSDETTATIKVFDSIVTELPSVLPENGALCSGNTLQIPFVTNTKITAITWTPTQFLDNPNIAQPLVTPDSSLYYYYNGTDIHGCPFSGKVYLYVGEGASADFNYLVTDSIYPDFEVDFTNLSSANTSSWYWDFGDNQNSVEENPTHTYITSNTYKVILTATSDNGCQDTAMKTIALSQPLEYTIPNVITPNADNINDVFAPDITGEYAAYSMQIFNRWGELVYETAHLDTPWKGKNMDLKELAAGTYYYVITITKFDGTVEENKGYVSLLKDQK